MIRKIIGMTICLAAIITQASAQQFGIELNGGLQGMQYSLKNGQVQQLPAGSFGLNYTIRLGNHLGLVTGITGGLYRTQATLKDGRTFTYGVVDDEGSAFQYNAKFTGYKETQQFYAAGIPVLLHYHTSRWYLEGGAKILVPFNASAQISAQQVGLTGYYPDFNVELSDLPQHGFGTIDHWKTTSTLKLKPAAALTAGTGMIFRLSPRNSLYAGLYVEYGLTDLKDNNDTLPLVTYSSNDVNGVKANSVLKTEYTGQATLLSYGLQIRLTFGNGRAKHVARHDTAAQTPIVAQSKTALRQKTVVPPETVPAPTTADQPKTADQQKTAPPPTANEQVQRAAAPPTATPAMAALTADETAIINEPVLFGTLGEASIPEMQKPHLQDLINLLKRHPNIHISIIGHYCDGIMETESKKVGEARAKAIARYLQSQGIARNRMTYSAAGKSDPAQPSDPGTAYQSRRVVIAVQ